MTSSNPPGVNVGESIRSGAVLEAREAVAIVLEMCRQTGMLRSGVIATPDALWIDENGALSIAQFGVTATTTDAASGIAMLLDTLLPSVERPEYSVTSSLRSLPARLRASAEAGGSPSPTDLSVILRRHLDEDAGQVLQHLFRRVRVVPPTGDQAIPTAGTGTDASIVARRPSIPLHSPDEGLGAFAVESESTATAHVRARGPDASNQKAPGPLLREQAGRPAVTAPRVLAALALVVIAGFVGYRSGRIPTIDTPQTKTAVPQPERELTNRPGETRRDRTIGEPTVAAENGDDRGRPVAPVPTNPSLDRGAAAPHALIMDVGAGAFSPSFAPSGRKLLFHVGQTGASRLFEAGLDQQGQPSRAVQIFAPSIAGVATRDYHPRLSPDAHFIAFDSDRDGTRGVYISNPDGSQATRLSGEGFAAVPSWSPDMKWLAFFRAEADRPTVWNLWLLNLASGTLSRQTSFRVGQVWGASWFPDSLQLCYSHEDRLIVTNTATGVSESFRTPRPGHLIRTPAVAPDGKRIIFQVFRDGVWLLDLQTGTMRRILDDITAEEFTWDPQGPRIAYHSRHDGRWRIWMATVNAPP